jgi:hypothetical protein
MSPSRPLLALHLCACLGGRLPVFTAADLNAKHVHWNSMLITRDRLLHDYAAEKSCLIYGPNTLDTVPYNSS